jgi:hypothetical protein
VGASASGASPLQRRDGRFRVRPGFDRPPTCSLVQTFKLERSVFGGSRNRALSVAFRLRQDARVGVDLMRNGRVVRRLASGARRGSLTHRLRVPSERLRRGDYQLRIRAAAGTESETVRLTARRL